MESASAASGQPPIAMGCGYVRDDIRGSTLDDSEVAMARWRLHGIEATASRFPNVRAHTTNHQDVRAHMNQDVRARMANYAHGNF